MASSTAAGRRAPSAPEGPRDLDDPALLELGPRHYDSACRMCHARPGAEADATIASMVPRPPHIAEAVADWRPAQAAAQKLKKGEADRWSVELIKTPDIVAGAGGDGLIKVGFAAESEDVLSNAREKLAPKGLHLIAANDITADGAGFGAETNEVVLLDRDGGMEELGLLSKYEVAHRILDRVASMLG